jgi:HAD superfamily hydrolase (TIGR01509 family)
VAPTVLLDLYGTLVEPDWPRLTAGRDAIADHVGVPPELAHVAWAATHASRMRGEYGSLEADLAAVFFAAAATRGAEPLDELLLADLAAMERANWCGGVRLYADSIPALHRLRGAGVRLAIVTNSSAEAASVIPSLGLDGLVELVLASCEARAVKPELLDLALSRLGVAPSDAVLVDDDPEQVVAAERMGMNAVLVRRTADDDLVARDRGSTSRQVVTSLADVPDLVSGAERGLRR